MHHAGLLVQTTARDDASIVHLSAGGRKGDDACDGAKRLRLILLVVLLRELTQDVIGISGLGPSGGKGDELGCIHDGATANSQQEVGFVLLHHRNSLHAGVVVRVCLNATELGDDSVAKLRLDLVINAVALDGATTIGHHHALALRNKLGKLVNAAGTKHNVRGIAELKVLQMARRWNEFGHYELL